MSSVVSISQLKKFPRLMWVLLFGAFITRGSYFMVWPFLSVILIRQFEISATEVGFILSLAAVISVIAGFIGSSLSDQFGRKPILFGCGILYIISFCLLANADSVVSYTIVITLCSIATEIWRPASSALIGDILKESETRELAMQSMYFMVNVGSAIGPMLGFWLGLTGEPESFYVTAAAFALFLLVLIWGFNSPEGALIKEAFDDTVDIASGPGQTFLSTLKIMSQDRLLQCLIVANILCMFIYGQMDSTLIQYLTRAAVPDLLALVSLMILTNALVIISCQFVLLRLMANISLVHRIQIGLLLLTLSQLWLAINPLDMFWGWIGAIAVMSLGEAILFPTMSVHVDRIAPDHLRGAYFGATSFYILGFALAPLGGGLMLDSVGGFWLYVICASLCLVVMYLYSILESLKRPLHVI
ncbi:MFS transporter [Pleionea sediminis]|uniref:MFS transporter n=1 Tax=Pleionea sediminis TaxID=2569479 RepID=UPI001185CE32|nr:MFS transporter [Pleionea sediminis]